MVCIGIHTQSKPYRLLLILYIMTSTGSKLPPLIKTQKTITSKPNMDSIITCSARKGTEKSFLIIYTSFFKVKINTRM